MRYGLARSIFFVACCYYSAFSGVYGQEVEQPAMVRAPWSTEQPSDTAPPRSGPAGVEFKPEMFLLEDPDSGELKQLIRFSLRDFEDLTQLQQQRARLRQPPRYSLQSLKVDGKGHQRYAALSVQIVVLANTTGWIKVPLRLNETSLVSQPKHDGPGKFFVEMGDADGGGLIAWIHCEDTDAEDLPTTHTLTLDVLAPLLQVAAETRLRLSLPAAPQSELQMTVDTPRAVALASDSLARVESRAINDQQTRIVGSGLKADFELSWREASGISAPPTGVLEATAEVLVEIDGGSVRSQADLKLANSASAFSRFRVRLPEGAELVTGDAPGYEISPVAHIDDEGRGELEIRMFEPNTTASVRLVTARSITPKDEQLELAGFEVVEAVRQRGRVAVAVDDRWQAIWGPQSLVRQVETLPAPLEREDLAARFEYSGQPYSLTARIVPRQTYISVEPEYQVDVFADHLELVATLQYTVRRAKVFQLQVDLAGWQLSPDDHAVGPEKVVDVDQVIPSRTRPLVLPLQESTSGTVELVIRARRDIPVGERTFQFDLPRPDGDFVESASLRIRPATFIEMTPDAGKLLGLFLQPHQDIGAASDNLADGLLYRCEGPNPRFAAEFAIREQSIAVTAKSQVRLDEQEGGVEQTLQFDVAHRPAETVTLLLPRAIADSERFKTFRVTLDGSPLAPQRIADGDPDLTQPVRIRISLPGARRGRFDLRVSYNIGPFALPPQSSVPYDVLLVMPADVQLVGNELTVSAPSGVRVLGKPGGNWQTTSEAAPPAAPADMLRLTNADSSVVAQLVLQTASQQESGATIVDRTWIQSQITSTRRQDRVVYRFTTERPKLEITLPPELIAGAVSAKLDEQSIDVEVDADRLVELTVLPGGGVGRYHVLELEYACYCSAPPTGRLRLSAPRWSPGTWFRRSYWQLAFPANQHVVWGPGNYVHEFDWAWQGFYWGRTPVLDETQLGSWSGGSAGHPLANQTNRYLYSRISTGAELTVHTASRSVSVFFASAVALIVGLVLIYVPFSRRPVCLIMAAVGSLAVAAIFPEPAIMFVQAGGLGLAMGLLALMSERYLARRRGPRMVVQGTAGSNHDIGSTRRHVAARMAGSSSSTKTAAVSLSAAPESKS